MAEPLWTSKEIARATGGPAAAGSPPPESPSTAAQSTPGDLFVALAGVRDGHEFVAGAHAAAARRAPWSSRPSQRRS